MGAAEHAVTAPPADRMQVVVLGMARGAKPGIRVPTAGTPLTVPAAGPLRQPRLLLGQRRHIARQTIMPNVSRASVEHVSRWLYRRPPLHPAANLASKMSAN